MNEKRKNLRKGAIGMKQALLIIDVQNDYFKGGKFELYQPEEALYKIEKALTLFRNKNLPVIHVQHISKSEDAAFFAPNTNGALIHANLAPLEGEYHVIKHAPNSFFETGLEALLKAKEITDVVICGMMTHMCVDTTTRACRDYGLNVILLEDACATRDLSYRDKVFPAETVHDVFMASLNGAFARVIKTDALTI